MCIVFSWCVPKENQEQTIVMKKLWKGFQFHFIVSTCEMINMNIKIWQL
jgi:hypothetical protein